MDFKNTVIIMTRNLGSPLLLEGVGSDGTITEPVREKIQQLLRSQFRPEFLNRIDEVVLFKPLTRGEIASIVDLLADAVVKRLSDRQVRLEITERARDLIVDRGYDPVYGARPLKRYMQRELETRIGRSLISGDVVAGATLIVDAAGGTLEVSVREPRSTAPARPRDRRAGP
ncbi:MAG: AAA family ATPase [Candidatus Riflebacteria bacterium]|nr:AAA family ATPase [Candidatus Riflebacteria bacterium]